MAKRPPVSTEGLSKDSQAFLDVLNGESDLSAVLVATSYISACLGTLLNGFLLKSSVSTELLDGKAGLLGSFNSRSNACYCLGLINKLLYQDLLVIAEIRNEFAHHHLALSFAVPEVALLCEKLSYAAGLRNENFDKPLIDTKPLSRPRNRFVISVVLISQQLLFEGQVVKHVQLRRTDNSMFDIG